MDTIDDLHQFLLLIANKNGVGYLAPNQRNRAVNHAEMSLFKDRIGRPEEYQPGRAVARAGDGASQKIDDDLAPFLVVTAFTPTTGTPHWPKPANFLHPLPPLRATYQPARGWDEPTTGPLPALEPCEVPLLTPSELAARLANTLHRPVPAAPVASVTAAQIQFYPPAALAAVTIAYRRRPTLSKWVGTAGAGGRLVYNSGTSIQTEWPVDAWNDLAMRALAYLGIHLRAAEVAQFAQLKTQQG